MQNQAQHHAHRLSIQKEAEQNREQSLEMISRLWEDLNGHD
jgi:hypothetical protein